MCTGKGSNVCPPRRDALSGTDLKSMRTLPRRKGAYCTICAFSLCPNMWLQFRAVMLKKRNRQRRISLEPLFLCLRIRKKQPSLSRRLFSGRGRRTRTLKNGFGDRYVTITSCPCMRFSNCFAIVPNRAKKSKPFSARSGKKYITRTGSDTGAGSNRRFFPSPPVKILPASAARTAAGSLSCLPVPGDRCPCRQNRSRSSSSLCLPH